MYFLSCEEIKTFISYHIKYIYIYDRTYFIRFDGISGKFFPAMVFILGRRSQAKIPCMARPNKPDMPLKRTKKVRLGIHRTQTRYDTILQPYQVKSMISQCISTVECFNSKTEEYTYGSEELFFASAHARLLALWTCTSNFLDGIS